MSFKLTGPRTTTLKSGQHGQLSPIATYKFQNWPIITNCLNCPPAKIGHRFVGSTLKSPVKLASLMFQAAVFAVIY